MTRPILLIATALALSFALFAGGTDAADAADSDATGQGEWISLFDGESLKGWRASENQGTFKVKDGKIVASGPRSHLFYVGPVKNHDFTDFELRAKVKTKPGANAGIYFHTEYQPQGWPAEGYEAQINNTHKDWRKTGSLYAIEDVRQSPAEDNEWFDYYIKVQGDRILIKVNGETTVDYTEPQNAERPKNMKGRTLDSGTFALQGHDPGSTTYFKDIKVRPLK